MKKLIYGVVVATGALMLAGCNIFTVGKDAYEKTLLVEKDKAEELELEVNMGAGELTLEQGSKDWVIGEAKYNNKDLEPEVSYKLTGDTGKIAIDQSKSEDINVNKGGLKNEWNLQVTNDVPIGLIVNSGASTSTLNLTGLKLEDLQINAGVGDLTVDLSGDWKKSFDVNMDMGVGVTTLILPKNVGVKVISEKGLGVRSVEGLSSEGDGVYVNDKFGKSDVTITVNADLGIGEFEIKEE
ncbi:toast rack family protein [Robertmurraya korlensis]|uniref:toast rack family protein n=1 Tax=Robertmurraya korlensis TaxID=519977 RepID=UPI000825BC2A|nr:toast rack family protein [Robertmurraya korlensis]